MEELIGNCDREREVDHVTWSKDNNNSLQDGLNLLESDEYSFKSDAES